MTEIVEQYQASGVWNMETKRSSCVVPERPLLISPEEERELIDLARATWKTVEAVVRFADIDSSWGKIRNPAVAFPEGLTMPPAIRIDTVRTAAGPKIVEVDPITAISLGETVLLSGIWKEAGFRPLEGLLDAIARGVKNKGATIVDLSVPGAKSDYRAEIDFLGSQLSEFGITGVVRDSDAVLGPDVIGLSAFMEDPASRKFVNKNPASLGPVNPLWGSLCGLAGKDNLQVLRNFDKQQLPRFLPTEFLKTDLQLLEPTKLVVAKPTKGSGSVGVHALSVEKALALRGNYVFQELLEPVSDDYGVCFDAAGAPIPNAEWVTRLSLYAGRCGLIGAQATARRREGTFTNAHGQFDAVQTTLSIIQ